MEDYLSRYLKYLIGKNISKNTIIAYRKDIEDFYVFLEENKINFDKFQEKEFSFYNKYLASKNYKGVTLSRKVISIRNYFKFLYKYDFIKNNPTLKEDIPKGINTERSILTSEEIDNILSKIERNSIKGIRDRAILEIMYGCGLKANEVLNIKVDNIKENLSLLICTDSKGVERIIPFGYKAKESLNKYLQVRDKIDFNKSPYVFLNMYGGILSRQGLWKILKIRTKNAGIKKEVDLNSLRHSFTYHLLENGADIKSVQELLGIKVLTNTLIYANINKKSKIKEVYMKAHPRAIKGGGNILINRVILIVLDSVGIGETEDAYKFGDVGSNTLGNISKVSGGINISNMEKIGIGNIDGAVGLKKVEKPIGSFGKCKELSMGKDTVTGHLEIAGVVLKEPLNTFPSGFSEEIILEFENKIGRKVIGNVVASGTEIIERLGEEHVKTGYPIVYTSADSVFQVAAHEDIINIEEQYRICEIAREMLRGDRLVGRIIARPFKGEVGEFKRTSNRKDFAIDPPGVTILDYIKKQGLSVMAVGKIEDIYNKRGITSAIHTKSNSDGIDKTLFFMEKDEKGLIFTNLVDFDSLFGHRNDVIGYKNALEEFDKRLPEILNKMKSGDVLIITADHGCDPTTASTDHSREHIPVIIYGENIKENVNIGNRNSFTDIGKSILSFLSIENEIPGESFAKDVTKED